MGYLLFLVLLLLPAVAFATDPTTIELPNIVDWVGQGAFGIAAIWLVRFIFSQNKEDKEALKNERDQIKAELGSIIRETRAELKENHTLLVQKQDDHSTELLAMNERAVATSERATETMQQMIRIADECSQARECKADGSA